MMGSSDLLTMIFAALVLLAVKYWYKITQIGLFEGFKSETSLDHIGKLTLRTDTSTLEYTKKPLRSDRQLLPHHHSNKSYYASNLIENIAVAVVITTGKRQNSSISAIRNTWGKQFRYIRYCSRVPGNVINMILPKDSTQASNEELVALKEISERYPNMPWYYKCDDDTFINSRRLLELSSFYDYKNPHYVGAHLMRQGIDNVTSPSCAGGVGYLISNSLMKLMKPLLIEAIKSRNSNIQVDALVARALNLSSKGTSGVCESKPDYNFHTKNQMAWSFGYDEFLLQRSLNNNDVINYLSQSIGFHNVSDIEKYYLWSLYKSPVKKDANDEVSSSLASKPCPANLKCVISFSLYGSLPRYTVGALRNSMLRDTIYPGWTLRFYYDNASVPIEVIQNLRLANHELVPINIKYESGMFERFLVGADDSVDWFIVRDVDSRLNMRDKYAVDEWMKTDYQIHTLRDHKSHCRPINGGLWGGRGSIPNLKQLVLKAANSKKFAYGDDQAFLSNVLYPLFLNNQMAHDSACCTLFNNSISFPSRRVGPEHVGSVYTFEEAMRINDMNLFLNSTWTAPLACRRFPDWTAG